MSNILIITDRIPPEHSATGRFMYHIADELGKSDNAYLVCLSDTKNQTDANIKVIKVLSRFGKYKSLIEKAENKKGLVKIFYKICYHIYYKYAAKKGLSEVADHKKQILKICCKIVKRYEINRLISSSNPFENQIIAHKLIKKFPNIKWFPYLMDSAHNNAVKPIPIALENRVLEAAKNILIMPTLFNDSDFCEEYKHRIKIIDLPIIPVDIKYNKRNDNKIIFIYAGLFYNDIRNPIILFEIFCLLPKNYELWLYSNGCKDIVAKYKIILGERLKIFGIVAQDELIENIGKCDIVINIGNLVINQVPSKIYDSIAYGKPILNLYQNNKDIGLMHLNKYPLCGSFFYKIDDNIVSQITVWCNQNKDKVLSYHDATLNLQEKTLSNVVGKIRQIIQN